MGRTPKLAWLTLACCALLPLLAPPRGLAQADHRLIWRSLHTDHFDIHYHEPLGIAARTLLSHAEAVSARVQRSLGLRLHQRVSLVLSDDDDDANGFANVLPYNAIRLRVVAPDDMSPLADYDHWLPTLLTHEHTHIVHLEQAGGLPRLIQRIFGRIYTPQHKLPPWFIEGLAVVEESAHTTGGRLRSTQFQMYLRMDALEDRILDLDWATFDGEPWPHGNVRYLYGGFFVQFIAERYGTRALGAFVSEYGRRLVPFGVNRALQRVTGKTFVELYDDFKVYLRSHAEAVQREVEREGRREGTRLTFHGELTRTPRFLSATQAVYFVYDARHVAQLKTLDLTGAHESERVVRVAGTAHPAAIPHSNALVYSAVDYFRGRYAYQELFRIDRDGRHRVKLTRGLRAREPDVSPDGKYVAYAIDAAGTSHLELAELSNVEGTRRIIVRSRRLEQVYTPRFSPDGKRIAYSAWSRGGYRDIWVVELETGERTRLTYDRAIDRGPVFAPDGQSLYFSSDRTGIANLYAYRFADGSLEQITNVVSGAFQPDVSPDGRTLLYVGYTVKGFDLYTLPLRESAYPLAPPPFQRPGAAPWRGPAPVVSEAYRPYPTLYPRTWEIDTDDVGAGRRLVLTTNGADVVGFHSYSARLAQDLDQNRRSLDLAYSWTRPRFPLYLQGTAQHGPVGFSVGDRPFVHAARTFQLTVGSSFAFPRTIKSLVLRADYTMQYRELTSPLRFAVDPNASPPSLPNTGTNGFFTASITHSTVQRQPYDISSSFGHSVTLWASYREPLFGASRRAVGYGVRAEQYVRFQFRESVLALGYTGSFDTPVTLGGYPAQIAPILDSVVTGKGAPSDYARLRGYPLRYGDHLQVAQLEYRFLITRINEGLETLPLFARRIHAALFTDIGDAYYGHFDPRGLGIGVGGELRLDWAGGTYASNYTLRVGVARGVTHGGTFQWYSTLAFPF